MTDSTMTKPIHIEPGDAITTDRGDFLCIHADGDFAWCRHEIPGGVPEWSPAYVWRRDGTPVSLRHSGDLRDYWATSIRKAVRT